MPCAAATNTTGYRCSIRGCPKRNNRLFGLWGLGMHMAEYHKEEYIKRLRVKEYNKHDGRMNQVR